MALAIAKVLHSEQVYTKNVASVTNKAINSIDICDMLLEVNLMSMMWPKSTPRVFFYLYTIRYRLDLSKEVLYDLEDQGAAKLQVIKVCTNWESNPGCLKTTNSLT